MWTNDKLREVTMARGEMGPTSPAVGRALLFFERWKGRTEEDYPRDEAKRELDASLEKVEPDSIPAERVGEFDGLRELRVYAREHEKQREQDAELAQAITEGVKPLASNKAKQQERER